MVKAMSMLYAHDFILCLVSISFPFFLFLLYFLCPLPPLFLTLHTLQYRFVSWEKFFKF